MLHYLGRMQIRLDACVSNSVAIPSGFPVFFEDALLSRLLLQLLLLSGHVLLPVKCATIFAYCCLFPVVAIK